ncbi:MAG TPA: peptide chain release factor N(5)-glutamine methyltransferase [Prolixibacteraceae bacterium]|nr:peptide chain release factor N(5)-glutamine methyltransferase [Prolixibacteraceae bacterium]
MKQTIQHIKKTLDPFYPATEIEGFIAIVFQYYLGYNATQMILNSDKTIEFEVENRIESVIERLKTGEPIQYILGETTFYDLRFEVNPSVLIPRFETEELVDGILKKHGNNKLKFLDIGTGSGAIAIAIKKNNPLAEVYACDISIEALKTAQKNADLNQVEVHFFHHDVLSDKPLPISGFDLIVSNPPYVCEKEKAAMNRNVLEHEPHLALFVPNNDPLRFYRAITLMATQHLSKNGELWFEINEAYGPEVADISTTHGFDAIIIKDINGKDRIVRGIFLH